MKFCDERIQRHLLNGGKITHSDLHYPIFLRGGTICFKNGSGEILSYSISEDDLTTDDWEIVILLLKECGISIVNHSIQQILTLLKT